MWSPQRPLAALLALVAVSQATCPGSPWREARGHCYRLTSQPVPWHEVRGECKAFSRKADAASITSSAVNDYIKRMAGSAGQQNVWLGMRSANGILSSVDGTLVTYRNFPNGSYRAQGAEDVVEMSGRTGRWHFAESHTAPPKRGVCKMASCRCPAGWVMWRRRCYLPQRKRLSWLEARNRCRNMSDDADLVSITDPRENGYVYGRLRQYPFWIGLNDREKDGTYVWSTGEKYSYRRWHPPTEPNGIRHSADCASMESDATWADTPCGAGGRLKAFVCEMNVCGRGEQIPPEPVRGMSLRLWTPQDGLRCPEGWSRSGDSCYSPPTAAATFSGVQKLCSDRHPRASVALIGSIEENDRAFFSASSLPLWVDYGGRSGRAARTEGRAARIAPTFTYWEPGVAPAPPAGSDCAAMQNSSQWQPKKCEQERLPALCQLPACNPECPRGWSAHEGHCYRVERERRTLAEAAALCQKDGAHLASIQSQEENDFITTLAFKLGINYRADPQAGHAWIGASRASQGAPWTWGDCDSWAISRWRNFDGNGTNRTEGTCATINPEGRWHDHVDRAAHKFKSVCELDPCRRHFGPTDTSGCRSAKVPAKVPAVKRKQRKCKRRTTRVKKTTKAAVTAPTTTPTKASKQEFICPKDWTELDGDCYRAMLEQDTLVNANQTCAVKFRPSQLASVHTVQQNQLLPQLTGGGPTWLGLTSVDEFPAWRWLDGSYPDISAWGSGQPDAGTQNTRACAVVDREGRWMARSCSEERHSYVCKMPAARN